MRMKGSLHLVIGGIFLVLASGLRAGGSVPGS